MIERGEFKQSRSDLDPISKYTAIGLTYLERAANSHLDSSILAHVPMPNNPLDIAELRNELRSHVGLHDYARRRRVVERRLAPLSSGLLA